MEDQLVILVIEDDQQIRSIVEDALTDGGFEPALTASGEEAVTLLQGNKGKYRALVTDISLRGTMDGWEAARQARKTDPAFRSSTSLPDMATNGLHRVFPTAFF